MLEYIKNILTNQFFLMALAITTGLLLGKIKIKSFSLGVSGSIFTGIIIGYFVTRWAHGAQEGSIGYVESTKIISGGVISQPFFTFFLLLFLVSIGLKVGNSIGAIFKKYGFKFLVIGVSIPVVSLIVSCTLYSTVLASRTTITPFETIGMFAGSMSSTPGYGAALDAAGNLDYENLYLESTPEEKEIILQKIDPTGNLSVENTPTLSQEQAEIFQQSSASAISLGYTVAFPIGVLVIVIMMSVLPKIFRIDIEKEKKIYQKEKLQSETMKEVAIQPQPINFCIIALVLMIGIIIGNINIPLGSTGSFSLGVAGGVLLSALILSYIGKIGFVNFRMDPKSLEILYQMGLTFFMAVVGLNYGYDVIMSLTGSGLAIALSAIVIEMLAAIVGFLIGHKLLKINWLVLSGAIAGGCTSAPGLGAAISSTGSDEPTTGYGAAQPFAVLTKVLLATIFFKIML